MEDNKQKERYIRYIVRVPSCNSLQKFEWHQVAIGRLVHFFFATVIFAGYTFSKSLLKFLYTTRHCATMQLAELPELSNTIVKISEKKYKKLWDTFIRDALGVVLQVRHHGPSAPELRKWAYTSLRERPETPIPALTCTVAFDHLAKKIRASFSFVIARRHWIASDRSL